MKKDILTFLLYFNLYFAISQFYAVRSPQSAVFYRDYAAVDKDTRKIYICFQINSEMFHL